MRKLAVVAVLLGACGGGGDDDDGGPPLNAIALSEWKATMTIDDFHTANMAVAWSTMKSTDNQLCTSCHTEYGSADEAYFFMQVVQDQEILVRFFAVDSGKISVNQAAFDTASMHEDPVPTHPPFDPNTAIGLTALKQFYMLTCAHQTSLCN